ncbi:MAG TPA: hypothetical protein VHR42_04900, partial [Clostridia bacterium]|nr:hypothetical protein [Clostridia bacterium]
PGGIMVLATPIKDSVFNRQYTSWWYEPAHLTFFEKDVMIKCAEDAHFDVSEIAYSEQGIGRLEFYCKKLSEPVQ